MKFRLSGEFGELSPVRNWQPHSGIDLAMPEGTVLRAINEGVVDRVYDGTQAIGKGLSIKFPDGTRAIYGHLNEVKAKVGEQVSPGEVIGLSGNTGNSTGAHLHFGLKDTTGASVDPTPLAEKLSNISGDSPNLGILGTVIDKSTEGLREKTAEMAIDIALGILDALKDFVLASTLVGSAVMLILKVAGWRDGGRWTGMLIVANILIKFLFGVY
jgi:hypothetical protein